MARVDTEFEAEEHRQRHTAEEPEPGCLLCCAAGWVVGKVVNGLRREMLRVEKVIEEQGRRKDWVAAKLGIDPSMLTRMLNGERRWTEGAKMAAARALEWVEPIEELFHPLDGEEGRTEVRIEALKRAQNAGVITIAEYNEIAEVLRARAE